MDLIRDIILPILMADIPGSRKGYGLAVELVADVPGLPREQAETLLHQAHEVCPYSNATRGNIVVDLRLA